MVAASALIALSGFFGGAALIRATAGGRTPAPPPGGSGQGSLTATAGASASPSAAASGPSPARAKHEGRASAHRGTATMVPPQDAAHQVSPVPATSGGEPTAAASPPASSGQEAVTVSYAVDGQDGGAFVAEVDVVNDGSTPISGWQIIVALPDDQIKDFTNAAGYVSHHILLLHPSSTSSAIPPGATLRVFFDALGTSTPPAVCSFNNITCG